jgi:DNA (cytosine-5)-methyltransferase 1
MKKINQQVATTFAAPSKNNPLSTDNIQFIVIDLFCGFGGTTHGYTAAKVQDRDTALVVACVNHDWKAIQSHWLNNPEVEHFNEDITKLYGQIVSGLLFRSSEFIRLKRLVDLYRAFYPNAKVVLWASLECTNFSNAKGGMARDADSRTLANHLDRYIRVLEPDYVKIENVVEFMSWGPLTSKVVKGEDGYPCSEVRFAVDATGKLKPIWHGVPESTKNGQDWLRWREDICSLGFRDEWKELNSANYGAYTSRNRLFGIFAKAGLPIAWPEPTHAKNPNGMGNPKSEPIQGLFAEYNGSHELKRWMPVKEVLDFADEGESIFTRKKPLSDNTLERIYAGLVKFVAKGDTAFISKYFSGKPSDKNIPVSGPAGTVKTVDCQALVQTEFLVKYNSLHKNGSYNPPSIDEPCPVISTQNRLYLAQPEFIIQRNGGDPTAKLVNLEGPARTLTSTGGNQELVRPEFLTHYYSGGGQTSSIDIPCPTVTAMDGKALVQPEYFIEKQYSKSQNQSVENPAGTIMPTDKHRLVTTEPFIMPTNYDNGTKSVQEPAPTITASRRHHYLINPAWGGNPGRIEEPCCVIVARQDKVPLYFVQVEHGPVSIAVYENDSPVAIRIKQFMAAFGLVDIKMRMLRVPELLRIQGFPENYKMVGNQSDQKKFIGNSVVPHVVKAWAEAIGMKLTEKSRRVA